MEQVVTLLTGILVAAGIFAATLFSTAQVYRQAGRLRWVHAAAALGTIAAMAALSGGLWTAAQALGAVLALTAPGWFYLYHVPLDAVWPWLVLALLLAANLATAFLGLSIIYASQCGLERLTLSVRIGALVIGSLVAVIGGMFLGAPGVALGTVTMTVLLNGVMSVAVRAKTRIATF